MSPIMGTGSRRSGGPRGGAGAVEIYPALPTARQSRSHRVRALGTTVFVERYAGVSYARFAMQGAVTVEIEVAGAIRDHSIFPAERVASTTVTGSVLRVELASPASVVIRINELEELFLLPDPMDDDAPAPGSPDVLDVTDELEANLRSQVTRIQSHPWIKDVPVHGLVYEVESGRLREVA